MDWPHQIYLVIGVFPTDNDMFKEQEQGVKYVQS